MGEYPVAGGSFARWPKWVAAIVVVLGGGGYTALELVSDDPPPCKPMIVVGPGALSCPHPDHVLTERYPYATAPCIECDCAGAE